MQVLAIKESAKCNNLCSGVQCCQALCPVSIFVSVCPKNLRKWTQTDTKVTFHPPPPTSKLFLVTNERYGKNKTF